MSQQRPFRFGVQVTGAASAAAWTETARQAEALGYDVLLWDGPLGFSVPEPLWPGQATDHAGAQLPSAADHAAE